MDKVFCDVCGEEIEGYYRLMVLIYEIKEAPLKKSPYREETKTEGYMGWTGTIMGSGMGSTIGKETYIDNAKICRCCEKRFEPSLQIIKAVFHPCKESVKT